MTQFFLFSDFIPSVKERDSGEDVSEERKKKTYSNVKVLHCSFFSSEGNTMISVSTKRFIIFFLDFMTPHSGAAAAGCHVGWLRLVWI